MSAATAWEYQPPHRASSHPDQCYYRTGRMSAGHALTVEGASDNTPAVTVFRWAQKHSAELTFARDFGALRISVELDAPTLRALHAALGDLLQDIAPIEDEIQLQASFNRISEEMRDADEIGGPRCYYAHPDIHYVPADQVAAKVHELEASGCKRYMVLAEPDDSNVVDASLEGAEA